MQKISTMQAFSETPLPWAPFSFAGFGTDRLRCRQAMNTAGRENPNRKSGRRWALWLSGNSTLSDLQEMVPRCTRWRGSLAFVCARPV